MGEIQGAVSLVVPTRNEAGNISELLVRLGRLPAGVLGEVIFVDDSDDDTPAAIAYLAPSVDFPVAVIHREPGDRTGGLSGAVVEGFRRARGPWLGVMDADLQHPPEVLADLFAAGESGPADIVCATRNVSGGGRDGLGATRDLISKSFTTFARRAFPRRLRGVSDPMSGFFLVRRSALDPEALHPTGFKILLEILVRTRGLRRTEVGYEFAARYAGDSKASLKQGVVYLRHLARLRLAA
ncbi:MAG TPA: polyprenol monophosphomannose synthase [Acidimicrobiia bacterium]|nr:polyprenol monophosphomannose synthase [Acidimicrobiia bacterium]